MLEIRTQLIKKYGQENVIPDLKRRDSTYTFGMLHAVTETTVNVSDGSGTLILLLTIIKFFQKKLHLQTTVIQTNHL